MRVIEKEPTSFFDVDETLVLAVSANCQDETIDIVDPLDSNKIITMRVHKPMIRLLKEEKHRGSFIVVWSRGGYEWAKNVVQALNLEDCVDIVMSKPLAYFDDKPIAEWLTYRVYLEPSTIYKETTPKENK